MGSIITNDALNTTIEELLHSIPSFGVPTRPFVNLTILLTPSFAQHASNYDLQRRAVQSRFHGNEPSTKVEQVNILVGVVDRLPSGSGDVGDEGLAYLYTASHHAGVAEELQPLSRTAQLPGSLKFRFSSFDQDRTYSVQLPLAYTIFHTALPSTLVRTVWQRSASADPFKLASEQKLESHAVDLPMVLSDDSIALSTPLIPLTPPRKVEACMGNIIRQLSRSTIMEVKSIDNTTSPVAEPTKPASEELEAAVQAYFNARNMAPEPVAVWVLVIPAGHYTWFSDMGGAVEQMLQVSPAELAQAWVTGHAIQHDSGILKLLRSGARLCRVLSGGGGWGKKAGLLSLDPDAKYSTRTLRDDTGWEFDFDDVSEAGVERQQREALGEIVRVDEGVMFFIAPTARPGDTVGTDDVVTGAASATFGSIPSSIDSVPTGTDSQLLSGTPKIDVVENHFGMLSEGGMALTVAPHLGTFSTEQGTQTKVDVPFSRITAVESGNRERVTRTGTRNFTPEAAERTEAGSMAGERSLTDVGRLTSGALGSSWLKGNATLPRGKIAMSEDCSDATAAQRASSGAVPGPSSSRHVQRRSFHCFSASRRDGVRKIGVPGMTPTDSTPRPRTLPRATTETSATKIPTTHAAKQRNHASERKGDANTTHNESADPEVSLEDLQARFRVLQPLWSLDRPVNGLNWQSLHRNRRLYKYGKRRLTGVSTKGQVGGSTKYWQHLRLLAYLEQTLIKPAGWDMREDGSAAQKALPAPVRTMATGIRVRCTRDERKQASAVASRIRRVNTETMRMSMGYSEHSPEFLEVSREKESRKEGVLDRARVEEGERRASWDALRAGYRGDEIGKSGETAAGEGLKKKAEDVVESVRALLGRR